MAAPGERSWTESTGRSGLKGVEVVGKDAGSKRRASGDADDRVSFAPPLAFPVLLEALSVADGTGSPEASRDAST
jgi:hypothetical protein